MQRITLASIADLTALPFDEVIDVRSPAEYAEDHIPGAVNLPVLDDAQRAQVGTVYVQESRFLARRMGAAGRARYEALGLDWSRVVETLLTGRAMGAEAGPCA